MVGMLLSILNNFFTPSVRPLLLCPVVGSQSFTSASTADRDSSQAYNHAFVPNGHAEVFALKLENRHALDFDVWLVHWHRFNATLFCFSF